MAAWLVTGTGAQDASDWGTIAALQLLLMLLTTVYTMATPTVAARRQGLVLERLRSAGLSHRESLGGLLAPIFAVALVLLVAAVPAGATAPAAPEGPALAVGLGALLCAGAAPATTRWTPGAELAQLTTAPFRFGRVAGAAGALDTHSHHARALLTPGGAVAALGLEAWATPGRCAVLPAALAGRGVTWEPRR